MNVWRTIRGIAAAGVIWFGCACAASGAIITLTAFTSYQLLGPNSTPLPAGSYVAIIGSETDSIDPMFEFGGGYWSDSVTGDDVWVGLTRVLGDGTIDAGGFTFDSDAVNFVYLRFFDWSETWPVTGMVAWGTSVTFDVSDPPFQYITVDFAPDYDIYVNHTNMFVVIPEPCTAGYLLAFLGSWAGVRRWKLRRGRNQGSFEMKHGSGRMNQHKVTWWLAAGLLAAGLGWTGAPDARAQNTPAYIYTQQPILDEFGQILRGHASLPMEQCDLVEIYRTTNGVVYPPDVNGNPDTRNTLVSGGTFGIGAYVSPELENPGIFCAVLRERPKADWKLFVRVYNASTRAGASFYGDSPVFTVLSDSANLNQTYEVAVTNLVPMDTRDFDNDGLINSLEKSYLADMYNPDSDGDNMLDGEEYRAGTSPTDAQSAFIMAWVVVGDNDDAYIAWESVPGKRYQVEFTPDDLKEDPIYENISAVVTASSSVTQTLIPSGFLDEGGAYRVRLVED